MAKRILIINEGYSSNLGDQAIKESMEKLYQSFGYETRFSYFTNPSVSKLPQYKYPLFDTSEEYLYIRIKRLLASIFSPLIYCRYYFTLRNSIKALIKNQSFDFIVIGGGQLINSTSKRRLSFFAIALFLWTNAFKNSTSKRYLVGVGAVGKFHRLEKYLYKRSLENVDGIWVMDTFSQKSLKENFDKASTLMPDVAFYESTSPKQIKKSNIALVGIYSFSEYSKKMEKSPLTRDDYYKQWKEVVQDFRGKGIKVILFYTTESDARETGLFQQYLENEGMRIEAADIKSLEDLNKLYETANFVYSARMHALILGVKKGCKVEASDISQKLKSFADEYLSMNMDPLLLSDKVVSSLKKEFSNSNVTGL